MMNGKTFREFCKNEKINMRERHKKKEEEEEEKYLEMQQGLYRNDVSGGKSSENSEACEND